MHARARKDGHEPVRWKVPERRYGEMSIRSKDSAEGSVAGVLQGADTNLENIFLTLSVAIFSLIFKDLFLL